MNQHDLRAARKRLGLTQAELAEALGLKQRTYISAMEQGKREVSARVAAGIATLTKLRAAEFAAAQAGNDRSPVPTDPTPADPAD